jgi:exodeoxyribonuclease VII large subunit
VSLFPTESPEPLIAATPHVFTVTEITQVVRRVLEVALGQVSVEGEISNYRKQASGHQYFTLKDGGAQLSCVLFARPGSWRRSGPPLADGMQIVARGILTVYEARGQYQLNVQSVQAAGAGLLQARFEALKRKLEAEGLFAPERKKSLPFFPCRIGIVTSPSGAALRDMLNVLERRSPWLPITIAPARVQGEGACHEIAAAIAELNRLPEHGLAPVHTIIVARGGGSVEDLWEFNEEVVARAIAASAIPVISAVGHETDFTIADFAADMRAPTPSAGAELVAPDRTELLRRLADRHGRLQRCTTAGLQRNSQHLLSLARSALFREPRLRLDEAAQRIDSAVEALRRGVRERLSGCRERVAEFAAFLRQHRPDQLVEMKRQRLATLIPRLQQCTRAALTNETRRLKEIESLLRLLSPNATLQRGYALAFGADGALVRSTDDLQKGAELTVRLSDGEAETTVQRLRKKIPNRK